MSGETVAPVRQDDPAPDFDAFMDAEGARFDLHNAHGHCYCADCEQYRERIR